MSGLRVRTTGLDGLGRELLEQTAKDALSPMARIGERLVELAQRKLSVRGGPSRPGTPPALERGALRDAIGRTAPYRRGGSVELAWGVGAGTEARARMGEHATHQGITREDLFAAATLHELGGTGADGRRYPPRPYIRPTEAELEATATAILEEALR